MSIPILIFATSKTRMKKFILIILTLLYAVVSSGITVNVHYCMGRMADVEWGSASACTMCGQKKTSDCCKDEAHYIKLAVDQDVNHVVVTNLVPDGDRTVTGASMQDFCRWRWKIPARVLLLLILHPSKREFLCLFIIVLI